MGITYPNAIGKWSSWVQPLVLLDMALFSYTIVRVVVVGLMLFCSSSTSSLLYSGHIGEMNGSLVQLLRSQPVVSEFNWTHMATLRAFLCEHVKMCVLIRTVNRDLWGLCTFLGLTVNFFSNGYVLSRLIRKHAGIAIAIETSTSSTIFLVQLIIILLSLVPIACSSKVMHGSAKSLPKVQLLIPAQMLHFKLKYLELYERVNREKKYGIQNGPTGQTITFEFIFQSFVVYFAFVLKLLDVFM